MTKTNNSGNTKTLKPAILQRILSFKSQPSSDCKGKPFSQPNANISKHLTGSSKIEPRKSLFKKNLEHQTNHHTAVSESSVKIERQNSKQKRESQVEKMRNRLSVGQFRYISEQLYTQTSEEASKVFRTKPELFHAYHRGYLRQQREWPSNPLDAIISELQQEVNVLAENHASLKPKFTIADFGCGEARLAKTILDDIQSNNRMSVDVRIHSFDFVAANEYVIAGDMAHTNLDSGSVDYAVYCLSLMGTNVNDFLVEANRVLKAGGRLRIAEVRSRFDSIAKFVKKMKGFGFKLIELRGSDAASFFIHFAFTKVSPVKRAKVKVELAPCIYKKR